MITAMHDADYSSWIPIDKFQIATPDPWGLLQIERDSKFIKIKHER